MELTHAAVEFDALCQLRPTAAGLHSPSLTRKRLEVTCPRCLGVLDQIEEQAPQLIETVFLWVPPGRIVAKLSITQLDDHTPTEFPWNPDSVRTFLAAQRR